MKSFDQIVTDLKLTPTQASTLKTYLNELVIELLRSIQDDNNRNFDETVDSLRQGSQVETLPVPGKH
ncbi:MAG: hypothetical protein WCT01_05135 [Candidatus Shapirobacteria bacterium]